MNEFLTDQVPSDAMTESSVHHRRLKVEDALMQELSKVAGITVSNDEDEGLGGSVRARRKEVVKFIQSLIDTI